MTTRRPSRLAALVGIALLVGACTGGATPSPGATDQPSPPPGESPGASPSPATIEGDIFAFGGSYETADEIGKERVDYFRENHPDVNVTFSEAGFDDQQFLTALNSGDPPDIARIPRIRIGTYIARGVIAPLDDCLAQTGADMGVFYEAAVNQLTVDGTIYGFPEFFNTRWWIINNAAFEDADLDPAGFDFSDWDAIAEANDALLQREGDSVSRIGIDPKIPEFLPLWAHANGVDLLSEDGLTSNLDDPAVIEAVDYTTSLIEAHGGFPPFKSFRDTWDFFGANNQVAADQVGAWPMEQWYLNVLASNSPDVEITVRPFMTRDGEEITYADGDSWAIVEGTDNYEAACQFAFEMTSAEAWERAARERARLRDEAGTPNTGTFSGNRDADAIIFGEIVDLSDMPTFQQAVQVVVDNQEKAFALPSSPAGTEFISEMENGVNAALSGTEPEPAMQQADQDAQNAIDNAAR